MLLGEGSIDVVVGTHRRVSCDVRFVDLGLIIVVDEERFGVSHKERLRRLRSLLEVLTMSATPMPRTLHVALMGLREISVITTPPAADRLVIRTLLARHGPATSIHGHHPTRMAWEVGNAQAAAADQQGGGPGAADRRDDPSKRATACCVRVDTLHWSRRSEEQHERVGVAAPDLVPCSLLGGDGLDRLHEITLSSVVPSF